MTLRPPYNMILGVLIGASLAGLGSVALSDLEISSPELVGSSAQAAVVVHDPGDPVDAPAPPVWLLRGPDPDAAALGPDLRGAPRGPAPRYALAYHYDSTVFDRAHKLARSLGIVRRGTVLPALERATGKGCKKGAWYRLEGLGYACSRDGFVVSRERQSFWLRQPAPELNAPLPYRYARVVTEGALRFHRIPSEQEEADIAAALASSEPGAARLPDVVQARMVGDYFVALDRTEQAGERSFYRTVRGRYVRAEDVKPKEPPRMHGEVLLEGQTLPYAFVHTESPVFKLEGGGAHEIGRAELHARFALAEPPPKGQPDLVAAPGDMYLPRAHLRIARRIARPAEVAAGAKWIHVDLTEQTLVAYEGDEPVFVTLVSTGKEESGHATPEGLFRVREKHVTVTMSGDDPVDGYYEVAEVPWTQFYHDSYALHGAYWHDTFGNTRSHGCTNIAPPDARWLFMWTTPELPRGFHARRLAEGTFVYLTRAETKTDQAG